MAAISVVFTIAGVAEMLSEDKGWLQELGINMLPGDSCLWVLDAGEPEVTTFIEYGIACLQKIIVDERAADRAPEPKAKA